MTAFGEYIKRNPLDMPAERHPGCTEASAIVWAMTNELETEILEIWADKKPERVVVPLKLILSKVREVLDNVVRPDWVKMLVHCNVVLSGTGKVPEFLQPFVRTEEFIMQFLRLRPSYALRGISTCMTRELVCVTRV